MFDTTEWETALATTDPLGRMRADVAELSTEERAHWTAATLSARIIELLELRERIDAETARLAAEWHRKRGWEADGALSPVAWATHRAPVSAPEARRLFKTANVIDQCPQIADALASGRTTAAHVRALARVLSPRRQRLLSEHEAILSKESERLTIKDFTVLARRWATLADDYLADDDHDEHHPHNEVHAAITMDGRLDGTFSLDPAAGVSLLDALDHLAPPDPTDAPDGVRGLAERRGDALADLANWYHQGATPGANPPSLNVVVDVATLNGATPELARARCDLEGAGPITRATLEQISCGATLSRLIMAGDSVILDMGRKTRFATPSQQRAVRIRDGGCIFPSCDRPAPWCDIHHVNGFAAGGRTDVASMVCLCRRHHTLIHNSKWTIAVNPDATFTVRHPIRAP